LLNLLRVNSVES